MRVTVKCGQDHDALRDEETFGEHCPECKRWLGDEPGTVEREVVDPLATYLALAQHPACRPSPHAPEGAGTRDARRL